ncbi:MAG: cytochrome ubiquinol oxidase subunit I, partial [Pseudomonadales bacterium]|nr:cytochrome ubiquinol oxidase subunit I [Pseudomonadales bacterium]
AVLAGWYVTEIGRQPFLVQGLLRIEEAVASHAPGTVLGTFIAYLMIYAFLLVAYIGALRNLAKKPAGSLAMPHIFSNSAEIEGV